MRSRSRNQDAIACPLQRPVVRVLQQSDAHIALKCFQGGILAFIAKRRGRIRWRCRPQEIARPRRKVRFDRWKENLHLWFPDASGQSHFLFLSGFYASAVLRTAKHSASRMTPPARAMPLNATCMEFHLKCSEASSSMSLRTPTA